MTWSLRHENILNDMYTHDNRAPQSCASCHDSSCTSSSCVTFLSIINENLHHNGAVQSNLKLLHELSVIR